MIKWMKGKIAKFAEICKIGSLLTNHYNIVCRDPQGNVKWVESIDNIVPNVGLDDVLNKYLKGSAYTASFFVGLTDGTPTVAATDTMTAAGRGWVEVTAYDEATREALTLNAVSGQSVDNVGTLAQFTINAPSTTIGGAFITTIGTKGTETGTLYSVAAFTGADKTIGTGDTLDVTVTLTAASAP